MSFMGFSALAGVVCTVGVTPAIAISGAGASASISLFESLPEYIEIGKLQQRNVLFGASGGKQVPFATLYNENRVELSWDQVPDVLKHAAVDGEDRRFYDHGGIDATSLARAAAGSAQSGELGSGGGGSTLTMQLVRNVLIIQAQQQPTKEERDAAFLEATDTSVSRKLQEIKYAISLEKKYTKDEILLAYLNIAYFGDQVYGVEAAAQRYFGKSARQLNVTEAASLIAIVQYPESRNLSRPDNFDANAARRNVILSAMHTAGHLSKADTAAARAVDPAAIVHLTPSNQGCMASTVPAASYFCDFVKRSIKDMPVFGATEKERIANWKSGGYQVHTTINLDLTQSAKNQLDVYTPSSDQRIRLGSVSDTVEAGTGRVIVMAQNTTFSEVPSDDPSATSVNFSTDQEYGGSAGFQVASTYKPFTLLQWLQDGGSIDDVIDSTPRMFSPMTADGASIPGYEPQNDGKAQTGRVTVRDATARSINTAYMAMAQQLDLGDIARTAKSLGIHRADGKPLEYINPSSVLGTNEIAPLTMSAAYAAIASGGRYCPPIVIDRVIDSDGNDLGGQTSACTQALTPGIAHEAAEAMQGLWTDGTGVGALPADGNPEIGKTGTSNDWDQIWIIGSTSRLATTVWQGIYEGPKQRLLDYSSPNLTDSSSYPTNRRALFKAIQAENNRAYPAGPIAPMPPTSP